MQEPDNSGGHHTSFSAGVSYRTGPVGDPDDPRARAAFNYGDQSFQVKNKRDKSLLQKALRLLRSICQ